MTRSGRAFAIGLFLAIGVLAAALSVVSQRDDWRDATVRIEGNVCGRDVIGGGALVAPDIVITSGHVVWGMNRDAPVVIFPGGLRGRAEIVHIDRVTDLAVLRIAPVRTPPVPLGDADAGDAGVVALVNADGSLELERYEVDKRIVALTRDVGRENDIERRSLRILGAIEKGDSGSVLIADGRAVGVIWARSTGRENTAYATRADEISVAVADAANSPSGPEPWCN